MATYAIEELKELGFELIEDEVESYYQLVLDEKDFFNSDYLFSEKVNLGEYVVVQYNNGENKKLQNWEVQQLIGNLDFRNGK